MAHVEVTGLQADLTAFVEAVRATNQAEVARKDASVDLENAQAALTAATEAEGESEQAVAAVADALKASIDAAVAAITE